MNSNIIQHTHAVAKSAYTAGAPTQDGNVIALIWQTRWMREAISVSSRIAYAETGVPPTMDNLKGSSAKLVFTMANSVRESNEYSQGLTQGKRSIVIDAGSMHRVDLSQGLSPDDERKLPKTDDKPSPPQEYNKYAKITNATPAIRL